MNGNITIFCNVTIGGKFWANFTNFSVGKLLKMDNIKKKINLIFIVRVSKVPLKKIVIAR